MGNHSKCFKCGELDEFCVCRPAPSTQQAAKAETAEQDESSYRDTLMECAALLDNMDEEADLHDIPMFLSLKLKDLAPTTSTVSAPGLLQEARELLQSAEPDATQDKADIGMCAQWDVDALALIKRIDDALRTTSGKGEAA